MTKRLVIAVLFGGQSSEHDVSCMSAANVIDSLNRDEYEILPVGITKDGHWLSIDSVDAIRDGSWRNSTVDVCLSPDTRVHGLLIRKDDRVTERRVDLVFPVLHGLRGEDGTVQGLLELARIPYVGCGVLASAVSMDKYYTKIIVEKLGIRQADYVAVRKEEMKDMDEVIGRVEQKLSYPVYIKPCNAGSSLGVSRAENRKALVDGLVLAAKHDRKILVEECIYGREVECAVLGRHEVKASGVGEILAASDVAFYDFEAKYFNPESRTVLDPDLPAATVEELREDAIAIFKAVDGYGLSRVDFFVTRDTNEVVFNEINTLPGFTAISMYPMLWENKGLAKRTLMEKLIKSALARYEE